MNKKLQTYLFESSSWYSSSCKKKGIQCGDGWFGIIDNLNFKIEKYLFDHPIKNFRIENISEVLGGLRIDTNANNKTINKYINEAISKSYQVCEYCGEYGYSININGWVITLCENCLLNPSVGNKTKKS